MNLAWVQEFMIMLKDLWIGFPLHLWLIILLHFRETKVEELLQEKVNDKWRAWKEIEQASLDFLVHVQLLQNMQIDRQSLHPQHEAIGAWPQHFQSINSLEQECSTLTLFRPTQNDLYIHHLLSPELVPLVLGWLHPWSFEARQWGQLILPFSR